VSRDTATHTTQTTTQSTKVGTMTPAAIAGIAGGLGASLVIVLVCELGHLIRSRSSRGVSHGSACSVHSPESTRGSLDVPRFDRKHIKWAMEAVRWKTWNLRGSTYFIMREDVRFISWRADQRFGV